MNLQEWNKYNTEIINSISSLKMVVEQDDSVLHFVKDFLKNNLHLCLGDLGENCLKFLKSIDVRHPEFSGFFLNLIGKESIEEIAEISELNKFVKRKNFKIINSRIKYLLDYFKKEKLLLGGKTLCDPLVSNIHTRFLPYESLWKCRANKKQQKINAAKLVKLEVPENKTDIFACYHHNSDKTKFLREELERKKKIFESINCLHMISEINSAIEKLDSEIMLKNFGFRRITLNNVASLLRSSWFEEEDIFITPINLEFMGNNNNKLLADIIKKCEEFPVFKNAYPVFDHYGIVSSKDTKFGIIVGERDTQTYFVGYYNEAEG